MLVAHGPSLEGSVVFHLSGRYGPGILDAAQSGGAEVAAVHPVRSMPVLSADAEAFRDTLCVAEGSKTALQQLGDLFRKAGAGWHEVDIYRVLARSRTVRANTL